MGEERNNCPKCTGEMREGFTLEIGSYDSNSQETWVEGKPEYEFWSGLKTSGRERYAITSYRCVKCGFLEQYAQNLLS
jgi:hypothetical protein